MPEICFSVRVTDGPAAETKSGNALDTTGSTR
jgi:hypothetical protein